MYGPSSHIITGDLSIVQDRELISFLKKGPKYRPPSNIIWKDCRNVIYEALNKHCKSWIKREKADPKSLDSFRNCVMKIVDGRIENFEKSYVPHNKPSKYISRIKYKLKELGKKFALVPADKASNNIIII